MNRTSALAAVTLCVLVLCACAQSAPEPQIVRETVVVEKPVTMVVEKVVTVEVTVPPEPTRPCPTCEPCPTDTPGPEPTATEVVAVPYESPPPVAELLEGGVEVGESRTNPVAVGQWVRFQRRNENALFAIRIAKVIRGEEAGRIVEAYDVINKRDLAPSEEWILVRLQGEYASGEEDNPHALSRTDFTVFCQGYSMPRLHNVSSPAPKFDGLYYPGATIDGWLAFVVLKADPAPLFRWSDADGVNRLITKYLWFALGE